MHTEMKAIIGTLGVLIGILWSVQQFQVSAQAGPPMTFNERAGHMFDNVPQ
jgi:hypothetical protein